MIDELMAYFDDFEAATNTVNAYINEILKRELKTLKMEKQLKQ